MKLSGFVEGVVGRVGVLGSECGGKRGLVTLEVEDENGEGDVNDWVWTRVFITSKGKIEVHVITPAIPPANKTFAAAAFWESSSPLL